MNDTLTDMQKLEEIHKEIVDLRDALRSASAMIDALHAGNQRLCDELENAPPQPNAALLAALKRTRQTLNNLTVGSKMSDDDRTILGNELENIRATITQAETSTSEQEKCQHSTHNWNRLELWECRGCGKIGTSAQLSG